MNHTKLIEHPLKRSKNELQCVEVVIFIVVVTWRPKRGGVVSDCFCSPDPEAAMRLDSTHEKS